MGNLAIISDLHVDINRLEEKELLILWQCLKEKRITRLHLAGDTANKISKALAVVSFFQNKLPVTYHWGNHEMADLPETMIESYDDPAFLNFQSVELSSSKFLLGVNGWYDYQFSDLSDEAEIYRLKQLFWYDRVIQRSATDPEISQQINHKLKEVLRAFPADKKIILSTHFVPKSSFIVRQSGKYVRWNHLNAFLGSPNFGKVIDEFDNVDHVVFGHTHRRFSDQKINKTIYSCRPFGYYFEWQIAREFVHNQLKQELDFTKLRNVLRKNQAAFDQFKEQHLKAEFLRAMTIIPY